MSGISEDRYATRSYYISFIVSYVLENTNEVAILWTSLVNFINTWGAGDANLWLKNNCNIQKWEF